MTRPFQSATIPGDRLLPGILGLRGIAALAVVIFHLIELVGIAPPPAFAFVATNFGFGVHLFFILSAYSLMHSTGHTLSRPAWAQQFFIKRLCRIAPLFYCVLAIMLFRPPLATSPIPDIVQIALLNLTFTFGLVPGSEAVWGGWAVGVEMMFYAVFPVLLLTLRSTRALLWLVLVTLAIGYASRSLLYFHYAGGAVPSARNWSYFSFAPNFYFFALGMCAYRLSGGINPDSALMKRILPAGTVLFLGVLLLTTLHWPLKNIARLDLMLWGGALSLLALWQGARPGAWCANRVCEYLGERSYSIYLLHPLVIVRFKQHVYNLYHWLAPYLGTFAFFACLAAVMLLLLLVAELSYRFIEIPGIRFGQRLNRKLSAS